MFFSQIQRIPKHVFQINSNQCTRRSGCDAKPHSGRPPAAAEQMPCPSKHFSGNLCCRNASKHSLASHRENHGPAREEHTLMPAGAQGRASLIPYTPWRCFGKDIMDLKQGCYRVKKQHQGQGETPPAASGSIIDLGSQESPDH